MIQQKVQANVKMKMLPVTSKIILPVTNHILIYTSVVPCDVANPLSGKAQKAGLSALRGVPSFQGNKYLYTGIIFVILCFEETILLIMYFQVIENVILVDGIFLFIVNFTETMVLLMQHENMFVSKNWNVSVIFEQMVILRQTILIHNINS